MEAIKIKPSPFARKVFGIIVTDTDSDLHLPLASCLRISVEINRGDEPKAVWDAVKELQQEGWIKPAPTGGWDLS